MLWTADNVRLQTVRFMIVYVFVSVVRVRLRSGCISRVRRSSGDERTKADDRKNKRPGGRGTANWTAIGSSGGTSGENDEFLRKSLAAGYPIEKSRISKKLRPLY